VCNDREEQDRQWRMLFPIREKAPHSKESADKELTSELWAWTENELAGFKI